MRYLLLIISLFVQTVGAAQDYSEAIDNCMKKFQSGIDPNNLQELESKMIRQTELLRKCMVGLKFPSFQATTLDGATYTLDDLKGKVVLINLWFITCPPCVAETPMFNDLQSEFDKKDFLILSFGRDSRKSIEEFIQHHPMRFNVFGDSKELIENKFKMQFGYPTNIFLDREGKIIYFNTGGAIEEAGLKRTKEEFENLIKKELNK